MRDRAGLRPLFEKRTAEEVWRERSESVSYLTRGNLVPPGFTSSRCSPSGDSETSRQGWSRPARGRSGPSRGAGDAPAAPRPGSSELVAREGRPVRNVIHFPTSTTSHFPGRPAVSPAPAVTTLHGPALPPPTRRRYFRPRFPRFAPGCRSPDAPAGSRSRARETGRATVLSRDGPRTCTRSAGRAGFRTSRFLGRVSPEEGTGQGRSEIGPALAGIARLRVRRQDLTRKSGPINERVIEAAGLAGPRPGSSSWARSAGQVERTEFPQRGGLRPCSFPDRVGRSRLGLVMIEGQWPCGTPVVAFRPRGRCPKVMTERRDRLPLVDDRPTAPVEGHHPPRHIRAGTAAACRAGAFVGNDSASPRIGARLPGRVPAGSPAGEGEARGRGGGTGRRPAWLGAGRRRRARRMRGLVTWRNPIRRFTRRCPRGDPPPTSLVPSGVTDDPDRACSRHGEHLCRVRPPRAIMVATTEKGTPTSRHPKYSLYARKSWKIDKRPTRSKSFAVLPRLPFQRPIGLVGITFP